MSEQELKLHVPAAARAAVQQQIQQRQAARIRLHAMYFDTPGRELARARIAIRLRQEGHDWVQTLKMPGANAISRVEINHPRPGPVLDLSVYAGTEAQAALTAIKGELGLRYETDVQRLFCKVRGRHGTVELAYDTGVLRAGALELPISELEFELVSGRPAAIFAMARSWLQRHGLVLDARSKSERGDALAQLAHDLAAAPGEADDAARATRDQQAVAGFWAPRNAGAVKLDESMTPMQAMAAVAAECVDHIARNAAVLAEVDTLGVYRAGTPEHVHQLRVGVRRLRSAWRLFDGWVADPSETLAQGARTHFSAFGMARDQDVLADTIMPLLARAGMPALPAEAAPSNDNAQSLAADRAFQGWLLELLAWSLDVPPPPAPAATAEAAPASPTIIPLAPPAEAAPPALRKRLTGRLRRWHLKVIDEGLRFGALELEARHELRKRVKRLRYGLSFAESLLPAARLRTYRKQLARVQDLLGEINDLAVARDYYQAALQAHPQAWFAVGWIGARLDGLTPQAQEAFDQLAHAKPFWK